MGFWSWLTGRDERESDLYANYEVVGEVTEELNRIATQEIGKAQEEVAKAIQQLNSARGFDMISPPIDIAGYDEIFQSIGESIKDVGTQLNQKAEDIKAFEESSPLEKFGSTLCMGLFKVGEGLLSVAEDLGDGIVSVVGWGAGVLGADGFQKDCENFMKKEWSHDVFNFYYNSDFAKASAFTEDSALAGGLKLVGKTVGYLYAGGAVSGALGWGQATNVGVGFLKASGTTWGATVASGVGGLGSTAESGLNQGLSYNEAMAQGAKGGLTSAALAFAGGKLSETVQANQAIKAATGKGNLRQALADSSKYQGYTDAVTKAGIRFGEAQRGVVSSAKNLLVARSGLKTGDPQMQVDYAAAKSGFKDSLSNLAKENPLAQGYNATVGKAVSGARQFGTSVSQNGLRQTLSNGATNLRSGITGTVSNIKANGILKSAVNGVKSVASNPLTYSVGATALASKSKEDTQAVGLTIQDMASNDPSVKLVSTVTGEDPVTVARAKYYGGATAEDTFTSQADDDLSGNNLDDNTGTGEEGSTGLPDPELAQVDQTGGVIPEEPVTQSTSGGGGTSPTDISPTQPTDLTEDKGGGGSNPTPPEDLTEDKGGGGSNPNTDQPTDTEPVVKQNNPEQKKDPIDPTKTSTKKPIDLTNTDKLDTNPTNDKTSNTKPSTNVTPTKQIPTINRDPIKNTPYKTPTIGIGTGSGTSSGTGTSTASSDTTGLHSGGGYGEDGYSSFDLEDSDKLSELDELVKSGSSIDEIIKNSKYAKIPSSTKPISAKSSGKSSAIPIAAGLSVAAAAGIGAKAYIDHKNQQNEEDDEFADEEFGEDDEFETDEWVPNIDELEIGEEDPNAAGFGDNDMASTMTSEDLAEV